MQLSKIVIVENDLTFYFTETGFEPFSRFEWPAESKTGRRINRLSEKIIKLNGQLWDPLGVIDIAGTTCLFYKPLGREFHIVRGSERSWQLQRIARHIRWWNRKDAWLSCVRKKN